MESAAFQWGLFSTLSEGKLQEFFESFLDQYFPAGTSILWIIQSSQENFPLKAKRNEYFGVSQEFTLINLITPPIWEG